MSQENVQIVRRGYELFAAGDLVGVAGLFSPDAEVADGGGLGVAGTASGTRAAGRFWGGNGATAPPRPDRSGVEVEAGHVVLRLLAVVLTPDAPERAAKPGLVEWRTGRGGRVTGRVAPWQVRLAARAGRARASRVSLAGKGGWGKDPEGQDRRDDGCRVEPSHCMLLFS